MGENKENISRKDSLSEDKKNDFFKDNNFDNLSALIKQILNPKSDVDGSDAKKEKKKNGLSRILDSLDNIIFKTKKEEGQKKSFDDASFNINNDNYFSSADQDSPYKLRIEYGKNVFEGYYERAMTELKKMKNKSYSSLAAEIESENLSNALVIIKDKKENNTDSFLFDSYKKAAVDCYKWANIAWWHLLYELQGKVIF